jgi:hypothetical protein
MQGVIWISLYLLRLALCPRVCYILEKVPWAAEKNVYSAVTGCNTLWTSVRSIRSMVFFNSRVSLLTFLSR